MENGRVTRAIAQMTRPLVLAAVAALIGCASQPVSSDGRAHAQCLVCKHNADLACVDVKVDQKTPRCVCDGRTYYFCSDECRREFEKNPQKYARVAAPAQR